VHPGTRRDAVLFSVGANAAHGLKRTNEDKRKAVMTLLTDPEWGTWSNAEIARRCAVDSSTVDKHRSSLPDSGSERKHTTKHGTEATMQVEKIGKKTGGADKSREAVAARRNSIREMAERGFTSHQIASSLGIGRDAVTIIAKSEGITLHADRVVGGVKRHDSTRILENMVMDAEHLTADVGLIDFSDLDPSRMADWLRSLKTSRDKLGEFIRVLMKEQQKHEAA
jgi:hypothetical protein